MSAASLLSGAPALRRLGDPSRRPSATRATSVHSSARHACPNQSSAGLFFGVRHQRAFVRMLNAFITTSYRGSRPSCAAQRPLRAIRRASHDRIGAAML